MEMTKAQMASTKFVWSCCEKPPPEPESGSDGGLDPLLDMAPNTTPLSSLRRTNKDKDVPDAGEAFRPNTGSRLFMDA